MKRFIILFVLVTASLFIIGCGEDGEDGTNGTNSVSGKILELTGADSDKHDFAYDLVAASLRIEIVRLEALVVSTTALYDAANAIGIGTGAGEYADAQAKSDAVDPLKADMDAAIGALATAKIDLAVAEMHLNEE